MGSEAKRVCRMSYAGLIFLLQPLFTGSLAHGHGTTFMLGLIVLMRFEDIIRK